MCVSEARKEESRDFHPEISANQNLPVLHLIFINRFFSFLHHLLQVSKTFRKIRFGPNFLNLRAEFEKAIRLMSRTHFG